jgi:hypothetical protein
MSYVTVTLATARGDLEARATNIKETRQLFRCCSRSTKL